jgi:hypothetical protein
MGKKSEKENEGMNKKCLQLKKSSGGCCLFTDAPLCFSHFSIAFIFIKKDNGAAKMKVIIKMCCLSHPVLLFFPFFILLFPQHWVQLSHRLTLTQCTSAQQQAWLSGYSWCLA